MIYVNIYRIISSYLTHVLLTIRL